MVAISDIYQLKLYSVSTASPVEQVNVFWYKLGGWGSVTPGDPVGRELALRFNTYVVAALNDCVNINQQYTKSEVVNYADPTDFDVCVTTCNYPSFGARTGDILPAQDCWSFRYQRPFPGARNGYKRFSGISELDQAAGVAIGAIGALLDALAIQLESQLVTPLGVIFDPVVARTPKVLGTNPLFYNVPNVVYAGIGTQNSRKRKLI